MSGKFEPVYVPADDVDTYGVEEEGWYVLNEDLEVFDGPFADRKDCLKAILAADSSRAA